MSLVLSLSTGSLFWRIIIRRPHLSAGYSGFYINCFTASRQRPLPPSFWHREWWQLWSHWQVEIQTPATKISQGGMFIYSRTSSRFDKKRSSTPKACGPKDFFFFKSLVRAYSLSTLLTHHLCPFVQFILIVSTNNGNVYCIITYNDVRCPTRLFPNHKPTE